MKNKFGSQRNAITAIEVIVASLVTATFAALLPNPLLNAREAARAAACRNNLRQHGIGLYVFADQDPKSRYCSGASDYLHDGCIDTYGFVADFVNIGAGRASDVRCPSNPAQASVAIQDLLGKSQTPTRSWLSTRRISQLQDGNCHNFAVETNGDQKADSGTFLGESEERKAIAKKLVEEGYVTNYATSYFLVRTLPKVDIDPVIVADIPKSDFPFRNLEFSFGPLTLMRIEVGQEPSNIIPLLADGNQMAEAPEFLSEILKQKEQTKKRASRTKRGNSTPKQESTYLSATFGNGPVQWDEAQDALVPLTPEVYAEIAKKEEEVVWWEDTRHWAPVHNINGESQIQILMADGSVKIFIDKNNDDVLNPGYGKNAESWGPIELEKFECFMGLRLKGPSTQKGFF